MDESTAEPETQMHARRDATAAIGQLAGLLRTCDPLEIISRVAAYILSGTPDVPEPEKPDRNEAHLEYLISLATAFRFPDEARQPSPDDIGQAIELLTKIHVSTSAHHMMQQMPKESAIGPLGEIAASFRLERMHVRGDAYWPHLRQTLVDLLAPHDARLQQVLGFTSADFVRFMERTEVLVNQRFDDELETHLKPFQRLMRPWRQHLVSGVESSATESARFAEFIEANSDAVADTKRKFDDFGTPGLFVITPATREEEAILAALTCSFGDNALFHGTKPEHTFWPLTDSLTERKPILFHDGIYYAFHLPKILRGAHTLIGHLLRQADSDAWKNKFLPARDDYLERETARLFQVALPNAKIMTTMIYDLPAQKIETESDVIVVCDDFLVIVECKAANIEPETRRGASLSVKSDLRKTIVSAQSQTERFVRELSDRGELELRPKNGGPETVIRADDFRWVARVSVTLELMSPVATSLWMLEDAGLLKNAEKCWSVSLNDLRVVVDILDSPSLFLHYLIRRMDLNALRNIHSRDEIDFLMHYVERGLFFRDQNQPQPDEEVFLSNFTSDLDQYYRRVEGISQIGKRPKVRVGKRTKRMLEMLESLRPRHYMTACLELLGFDTPGREKLIGNMPGQLNTIKANNAAFAFSFMANSEARRGIALATARNPETLADIVLGRAVRHCRENGLDNLCVILQGIPLGVPPIFVLLAQPDSVPTDRASRLLRQLKFETKEHRPTSSGDSKAL